MEDKKDNKVDGIKKADKKDLAKSRKIVLEALSEVERQETEKATEKDKKKVDGIISKFRKRETGKPPEEGGAPDFIHDEVIGGKKEKYILTEKEKKEAREYRKRIEQERKKQEERVLVIKQRAEEEALKKRKREEEIVLQEKKKQEAEAAEKKRIEEEKWKKEEEKKRKEEEKKRKNEAKKQEQAERQERREERKQRIIKSLKENRITLKYAFLKAVYLSLVLIIIFILLYLTLSVIVLRFNYDNKVTRFLADYFPVPAIITENGIIEYFDYKDLQASLNENDEAGKEFFKLTLAKEIILNSLLIKYGINREAFEVDNRLMEELSYQIAADEEINQVGLERIKRIKAIIDKDGDFVQTAAKYGDELGQVDITPENEDNFSFTQSIRSMSVGEISDIIITPEGYYIFKCFEKERSRIALSYLFIEAKTINDYIDETAGGLKMWSLVD